jgi:hypothetical protein
MPMNESLRSQLSALRSQTQATVDMCDLFLGDCRHDNVVETSDGRFCLDCETFVNTVTSSRDDEPLPNCPHPEGDLVNITAQGMKQLQFQCKRCGEIVMRSFPDPPKLVGES